MKGRPMRRFTALLLLPLLLVAGACPALAASGNTLFVFTAEHATPPAASFATFDTRNTILVLDFDASSSESTVFRGVLPRHYAGGGITCVVHWTATSATTGDVVWDLAWERGSTDLDSDGFATANTVTTTTNGTSGIIATSSITFTDGAQIDSVAVGEHFRLKLTRDVSDAADTMAGDAEFHAMECRES
jgi:hypothetical protein